MAIVGVGYAHRPNAVRWRVITHIVTAWFFTFPICGLIAYCAALLIS